MLSVANTDVYRELTETTECRKLAPRMLHLHQLITVAQLPVVRTAIKDICRITDDELVLR